MRFEWNGGAVSLLECVCQPREIFPIAICGRGSRMFVGLANDETINRGRPVPNAIFDEGDLDFMK